MLIPHATSKPSTTYRAAVGLDLAKFLTFAGRNLSIGYFIQELFSGNVCCHKKKHHVYMTPLSID